MLAVLRLPASGDAHVALGEGSVWAPDINTIVINPREQIFTMYKQQQHPYLFNTLIPIIVLNNDHLSCWITWFWQIWNRLCLESKYDSTVSSMSSKYNSVKNWNILCLLKEVLGTLRYLWKAKQVSRHLQDIINFHWTPKPYQALHCLLAIGGYSREHRG